MENFGIGVFFLGPIKLRYETELSYEELEKRLERSTKLSSLNNKSRFSTELTFFKMMFPFNHFVRLRGKLLKNNIVEITIMPILVRVIQLSIITMYSLTLSGVRLYDNRSWEVLGILSLHFAVLCTVWWVIRLVYVADARNKVRHARRWLKLHEEEAEIETE